ncbi:MAG: type II toxin-antitoxin system HicA family toxin [Methylococcales bacterium]|jgi:predicted RNA binding protein YcfA (HicA-like mRNA interferase family)
MSSEYPPITCKELKLILAYLGFVAHKRTGTSHEQWIKDDGGKRYKVTVDCPKSPFSQNLISIMAQQAGTTKKHFYQILKNL